MTQSTQDRIINAAIELVKEKGFVGATTREIAKRAQVNEVTLFRHFGNKKGIIEAAIEKLSFVNSLSVSLSEDVVWDLTKDLSMLVKVYQTKLEEKRDLILISFKEAGRFPELDQMISGLPMKYKEMVMDYFQTMIQKGKVPPFNVEIAATNFLFLNFGYFMLKSRLNPLAEDMSLDKFINQNVAQFIDSLQGEPSMNSD